MTTYGDGTTYGSGATYGSSASTPPPVDPPVQAPKGDGLWNVGQWNVNGWGNGTEGLVIGGHRFRLLVRWYDREDLFPTYWTWYVKEATYTTTVASFTTYADLLDNVGGGVALDHDLTCDLSGMNLSVGSDSSLTPPRAATLRFSLNDPNGFHDPRRTPVQGRTRTGARVTLDVKPGDTGAWLPMFTGWIESWKKALRPNQSTVDVDCSDAFNMMARAKPVNSTQQVGAGETSSVRMQRCLDDIPWNAKWGPVDFHSGGHAVNPIKWDGNRTALDHMHQVMFIEDGLFAVKPDGTIHSEADGWRSTRTSVLGVDLAPNDETPWETVPDDITCPAELSAVDDDLDLVNRVTVWRSVEWDAEVGDPPAPPEVDKRDAESTQSISWHGVSAQTYGDQPNWSDARSQTLATAIVDRYSVDANDIGDASFDLMKRPADALPVVTRWYGDTVVVRGYVGDSLYEQTHEWVGVRHRITPYRWEATVLLDRKAT